VNILTFPHMSYKIGMVLGGRQVKQCNLGLS
jgi:hypothetical protein